MPDRLNEGLPSDRVYVEWRIATDRADARLRGAEELPTLEGAERDGVPYLLRADGDRPARGGPGTESHLLVEIPHDFQVLKHRDRALALEWRLALRATLEPAFKDGYAAVEFLRDAAAQRGAYLLFKQAAPAGGTA
jgi:predicted GNAT superfamily acetyltransferase